MNFKKDGLIQRDLLPELREMSQDYPVVTVIGPRQSGKTTLVQQTFPEKPYVNLEPPDVRLHVEEDPRGFLAQYPQGAILDEIQRVPQLLSYIQESVDQKSEKGLYILTGSHQFNLNQAISQSLAGRTTILKLLPFTFNELSQLSVMHTLDEYLWKGFFPRIHHDALDPTKAYRNYVETYLERDLRQLIQIKDLSVFQKFLKLCAGRIGQVFNMHSLAGDLGISSHTVRSWISILEASFIIVLLQPYFENIGKRLIKSPKLYFIDVGLATYLLGIENTMQLERDPLRGQLFENLIVLELFKMRYNLGLEPHCYYYRDSQQHEVDILYQKGSQFIPIEIKSGQTFRVEFFKNLKYFKKLVPEQCSRGYVVYAGEREQHGTEYSLLNFKNLAQLLKSDT
jgi:hypothetical protein